MQGTVWDSAGSNEFVAEKSMVRCTEQGLHYLHCGGNHGCTELCQPESHAPDGGTGKAGRLIERKRQGLGRPNLIYVKNFAATINDKSCEKGDS